MARVKRAVNAQKKRREVLELASGYRGQRSRLYRKAKEQVTHSLVYAYRDRRARKGDFRRLWIQRVNAAARENGITYNRFIQGLKLAGVEVDRRILADLAVNDPAAFAALVDDGEVGRAQRRHQRQHRRLSPPPMEEGRRPERPEAPLLSNPGSDRVRAVRRLSGRSARRREGRFIAEGPQSVTEAVAAHVDAVGAGRPPVVLELYATPDAAQRYASVLDGATDVGCVVRLATPDVLAAMSDTVTSQGLVAVCAFVDVPLERLVASSPRLVAVLAHVRDPGNAGTVVRAADAAGAGAVVLTDASVDVFNPKCVRASAGSLFHLPVATGVPLAATVQALRGAGLVVLAADVAGTADLDELQDDAARGEGPLAGPVAWVFGNEAWGLPDDALAAADAVVRVPVYGRAESLNLATAATVCLYASARHLWGRKTRAKAGGVI